MPDIERRRALLAAGLMGLAAAVGQALVPTRHLAQIRGAIRLDGNVPRKFADWEVDESARGAIINPQTEALLQRLYTEILERTYVNTKGQKVMLSIAYGADQSDPSVQLHYPEICYPAQGFKVQSQREDTLRLPLGTIAVRRLETNYAGQRPEPVTYWTMMGDLQSLGGFDKRWAEIRHGLRGEIVDGVLMRVSTIDADSQAAFQLQDRFVADLLSALPASTRHRLSGL
jgi:EpsI family protein